MSYIGHSITIRQNERKIVMQMKMTLAAVLLSTFTLVACSKQESAPASEQVTQTEEISAEQQALIDSVDQPIEPEVVASETESAETAAVEENAETPAENAQAAE